MLWKLDIEVLLDLVDRNSRVRTNSVLVNHRQLRRLNVILILNITEKLFDNIFNRDESRRSTEFVYDDRHVNSLTLKIRKQIRNSTTFWNEVRNTQMFAQLKVRTAGE